MRFTSSTVAAFMLTIGAASAFTTTTKPAFVPSHVVARSTTPSTAQPGVHSTGCHCAFCVTRLFMSSEEPEASAAEVEVPPEVEQMDGIASPEEAHNAERPARSSIAKKKSTRKPLNELEVGQMITAKVKTITSYGAFMDIGATTDGLLHISNLAADFVSDVKSVLEEGKEYEVRIINIDEGKSQVGLSLLTAEQEEEAKNARPQRSQQSNRGGGGGGGGGGGRRDDSAIVSALAQKGFDAGQFVEGTVASTVDFGAFVRFDASQLNSEVTGEMDGLVHISALTAGRADSVTSVCKTGDKVQIRVKAIEGSKVSLSMISVEDEAAAVDRRSMGGGGGGGGGAPEPQGAKDWKESLDRMTGDMPEFTNSPLVVDLRK